MSVIHAKIRNATSLGFRCTCFEISDSISPSSSVFPLRRRYVITTVPYSQISLIIGSHWSSGSILAVIHLFKSCRWPFPCLACMPITIILIFNYPNYFVARILVGLFVIEVWVIDRMPLTVIKSVFTQATYWAHASAQTNPFLRRTIFTIVVFLFFGESRHGWRIAK